MVKEFAYYSVDTTLETNHLTGMAKVCFFDHDGNNLEEKNMVLYTQEWLYNAIAEGDPIVIEKALVRGFSMGEYRKQKGLLPSDVIDLPSITITHSLIEAGESGNFDFSFTKIYGSFHLVHCNFAAHPLNFSHAEFMGESVVFDNSTLRNGFLQFSHSKFNDADLSFKNCVIADGIKDFEDASWGHSDICFVNAVFNDGDLVFEGARLREGKMQFKMATIGVGRVEFSHMNFGKADVSFERTHFGDGAVNFRSAVFEGGKIDFTRALFGKGQISFTNTEFGQGKVLFVNTEFSEGKVNFKLARFQGSEIDFHYSSFGGGDVVFDRVEFGNGLIDFRAVDFKNGKITFYRTVFGTGDIIFEASTLNEGRMIFDHTQFGLGVLNFETAECQNAEITFDSVLFRNEAITFNKGKFRNLNFIACQLNNYCDLRVLICDKLILRESIIRDIVDMNPYDHPIHLNNLNLSGVRLLGNIFIDWRHNDVKELIYKQTSDYRSKSEQFRTLKQNYYGLGQYSEEDLAYVEFKRTELEANLLDEYKRYPRLKLFYLFGYWAKKIIFDRIGLYATNPIRVLASMAMAYFMFSLLYVFANLFTNGTINSSLGDPERLGVVAKSFYYSGVTFFTIGYGDYYPMGGLRWLAITEGFTGVFMMSYFTVAFVRKILR